MFPFFSNFLASLFFQLPTTSMLSKKLSSSIIMKFSFASIILLLAPVVIHARLVATNVDNYQHQRDERHLAGRGLAEGIDGTPGEDGIDGIPGTPGTPGTPGMFYNR
jgi:hypothetical protein